MQQDRGGRVSWLFLDPMTQLGDVEQTLGYCAQVTAAVLM
jgi:hypothetical protein